MAAFLKKFWLDEEGAEGVEYPLVIALVVIGAIALWLAVGDEIKTILGTIIAALGGAQS